ncbi:phosphotransferase [Vallicoccus soli]|uniref:Aminoglycoside phosphotransferase domain-containing protein n=1 Tax=Vallicoccus soli TaxID=2339232 RepID=A0A3A3Z3D2_9ACTN|nr:hypothetical protein [Vallicoccus soli]RJK97912.1 hypothetical protein D5H78_02795 [Vallicoccus soli]
MRELPAPLVRELHGLGVDPARLVEAPAAGPPSPVRHLAGDGVVVDVASAPDGVRRVLLELRGRAWAAGQGVRTVPVLRADAAGRWAVSAAVRPTASAGADYVLAALEAARRVARAAPPPAAGPAASTWRAPRRTVLARAARARAAGVPLLRLRRARGRAAALPVAAAAHGDFHARNVLGTADGVLVVDWEHLGPAPAGTDAVRLWTTLRRQDDRDLLLEHLLRGRTPVLAPAVLADLLEHLGLRLWAENVSSPRSHQRRDDREHARQVAAEARALAADLRGRGAGRRASRSS